MRTIDRLVDMFMPDGYRAAVSAPPRPTLHEINMHLLREDGGWNQLISIKLSSDLVGE